MQKLSLFIATLFIGAATLAQEKKEYRLPDKSEIDTSAIAKFYKQSKPYKLKSFSPKKKNGPADKLAKINPGNMPVVLLPDKGLAAMPNFYNKQKDICVEMPNAYKLPKTEQKNKLDR